MILYQLLVSLYSFKVRLALRLKGLDLDLREPPGGTYRSPEFRAINPAGTVPALADDGFWLCESDAIIEYLDELRPDLAWRSRDPQTRARDRMLSRWIDLRLEASLRLLFPHVAPATRGAAAVQQADSRIAAALALIESGLDVAGPHAAGASPGLADCGLAAACVWLEALRAPLALSAASGPRARRAFQAMNADPRVSGEMTEYAGLVEDWVRSKL
jgi:glutathione S-transferase